MSVAATAVHPDNLMSIAQTSYRLAVNPHAVLKLAALGRLKAVGEALDLTTPSGRALAGMLAVFAEFERDILRDRVKAGIAQAHKEGRPHGRPPTIARHSSEVIGLPVANGQKPTLRLTCPETRRLGGGPGR
jgi:Resolvase, N terminal domain